MTNITSLKSLNLIAIIIATSSFVFPLITTATTLTIGSINPNSTVPAGTTISFKIDSGDTTSRQYIINDSAPGSTLSSSNINNVGQFNWQTGTLDIGTHNLTITAVDLNSNRTSINQTLVVGSSSPLSILNISPGTNISPTKVLSFSVGAQGYTSPTFYVLDSFGGSSLTSNSIDSFGNFSWVPKINDVGVHNLSIRVVGSNNRNDVIYQTVNVNGISAKNQQGNTVTYGSQINIEINSFGVVSPTYKLSDSQVNNTFDNGNLDGNIYHWTPTLQDVGSHTISITATDVNGNTYDTKTSITINASNFASSTAVSLVSNSIIKNNGETAVAKYNFTKSLNVGSKGTEVSELQKLLKELGFYSGPINGNYGPLTKAGVTKFQKARKISTLGNVGPATRKELNRLD